MTPLQIALTALQRAGIGDRFVADKIGVAPQTVYSWRTGRYAPQRLVADAVIALAEKILSA